MTPAQPRRAPLIRGGLLLGSLLEWRRDPIALFARAFREGGDVAALRLGPRTAYLVSGPAAIERVLVDNHRAFSKRTPGQAKLRKFLGDGLLTSAGSFWLRQRRMTQPAFHRERLEGFAAAMSGAAGEMLERWEPLVARGETFDLTAETSRLTLRIVSSTLLGFDARAEAESVGRALSVTLGQFRRRLTNPLLDAFSFLPTKDNRELRAARAELDRVVHGVIAARRREPRRDDLLSMLMAARDEDTGEAMDDLQLRDEVMTLFLAGFETTANALNWAFVLLARHPEIDARLRAETSAALGARAPALADLPRLTYALAVIKEAMRLYPPAWLLARRAESADVLSGVAVPKGALVLMSPYVVHRHPAFWKDPERFEPRRFLDGGADDLPRFAYFPFGGGPRQCIGSAFALMEAQLILARVVQKLRVELADPGPVVPEPTVTLRPRGELRVRAVPVP
jgi:cytochrome P450